MIKTLVESSKNNVDKNLRYTSHRTEARFLLAFTIKTNNVNYLVANEFCLISFSETH